MSVIQGTGINAERRGYGRGLILGLTMAETMLLLVFCLLLVAGAIVTRMQKEVDEAQSKAAAAAERVRDLEKENRQLSQRVSRLIEATAGRRVPEEEWRELVLAKADMEAVLRTGLTVEEVIENAPAMTLLRDKEITPDEARELILASERIATKGITLQQLEDRADFLIALGEAGISEEEFRELVMLDRELASEHLQADDVAALAGSISVLKENGFMDSADPARDLIAALQAAEEAGNAKPHEWPPIISLSELEGYNFTTGSAELSVGFREKLAEKSAEIAETAKRYDVDIIEVIGHTDEQAMAGQFSNMDRGLKPVLDAALPIGSLRPADNAGLGLARAISVAMFLKTMPELAGFTILPMSGGQLILPGDKLTDGAQSGDVKARRRIEVRVRKRSTPQ